MKAKPEDLELEDRDTEIIAPEVRLPLDFSLSEPTAYLKAVIGGFSATGS